MDMESQPRPDKKMHGNHVFFSGVIHSSWSYIYIYHHCITFLSLLYPYKSPSAAGIVTDLLHFPTSNLHILGIFPPATFDDREGTTSDVPLIVHLLSIKYPIIVA